MTQLIKSLISSKTLFQKLSNPTLKIIDGSWHMPASGRKGHKEFLKKRIPGAMYFDIDEIADLNSDLPHMLPTKEFFEAQMNMFAIKPSDHVVIYDTWPGLGPACRVYWTFKVFGHETVSVLDGGLEKWVADGYPTHGENDSIPFAFGEGNYKAEFQSDLVSSFKDILSVVKEGDCQIVDARPGGRFAGVDPDPRPGVQSGHIPGSLNLPFGQILTHGPVKTLLPPTELKSVFTSAGVDLEKPLIFSCGSGVTASILYFATQVLNESGVQVSSSSVYDGSWSEYGRESLGNPVAKRVSLTT